MLNIEEHGIEIHKGFLSTGCIQSVIAETETQSISKHGIRNAEKKIAAILDITRSQKLLGKARKILGKTPHVVRVLFFDKTLEKNWFVAWHQDKTVAVNKKWEITGWRLWTRKDGTYHAQPPFAVLREMVTFRLHLDATDQENGCLKVILGSHKRGLLTSDAINEIVTQEKSFLCAVNAGDAVIMRPYLLHSSHKAIVPKHRRIIHIELSSYELPVPLSWASSNQGYV